MGYRSDVVIAMYADEAKDSAVIKLWLKENFPIHDWKDDIEWFERGLLLSVSAVKWYEDYAHVKRVLQALESFEELFISDNNDVARASFEYVRIGESDDDTEINYVGNPDFMINLQRSISVQLY
jgi:hypothetical protein